MLAVYMEIKYIRDGREIQREREAEVVLPGDFFISYNLQTLLVRAAGDGNQQVGLFLSLAATLCVSAWI